MGRECLGVFVVLVWLVLGVELLRVLVLLRRGNGIRFVGGWRRGLFFFYLVCVIALRGNPCFFCYTKYIFGVLAHVPPGHMLRTS